MKNYPKVSIIIVNWNGKKYLRNCLTSVFNQTYPNYEVMLVDNGSTDDSVEYTKKNFPITKIIQNKKNIGLTAATNKAIEQCNGKYIVTLDNDTKVEPKWLEELVRVGELDDCIGSCQSKVLLLKDPKVIDAVGISIAKKGGTIREGYGLKDGEEYNQTKKVLGASTAVLYKKKMLDQIGLFDDDFFAYYEDVDFALRARLAGWKCMYVPKAIVYHIHSATLGKSSPFKLYLLTRNEYYYKIKNLPTSILVRFSMTRPIAVALRILGFIKNKEFRLIRPYLRGNFDALKNIPKMLKKRKKIKFTRLIQDKELREWFK